MADAPLPVNQAYRPGKQALEKRHRSLVTCSDTQRLTGSIDLDATLAQEPDYANQPRWDYGIGVPSLAPNLLRRHDDADPAATVGQDERLPGSQSPDEVTGLLLQIRRTDDSHRRSVNITAQGFDDPDAKTTRAGPLSGSP